MSVDWQAVVAYALTGERLAVTRATDFDAALLARDLVALGWERARVESLAEAAQERGEPYPCPVPSELRPGIGAAQLAAVVRQARLALGLIGADAGSVSTRTDLDADERRLLAEVPPHYM